MARGQDFSVERLEGRMLLSASVGHVTTSTGTSSLTATTAPTTTTQPQPPPPLKAGAMIDKNGVLVVTGDAKADTKICVVASADGKTIKTTIGTQAAQSFDVSKIKKIVVFAGSGNDTIKVDVASAKLPPTEINAGDGNDSVTAGAEPDCIHGGLGNDTIIAGAGDDVVDGGPGADSLMGGDGNDTIIGNAAEKDFIDGGSGTNQIVDPATLPPPPKPGQKPTGGTTDSDGTSETTTSVNKSLFSNVSVLS